jgi:hypothetical protein
VTRRKRPGFDGEHRDTSGDHLERAHAALFSGD